MSKYTDDWMEGLVFSNNNKFDFQLSDALINERGLARIFATGVIERIEQKSETYQWEQTGNIAIEYMRGGKLSGISVTDATCWVHELRRDGETLVYLMFPIERLKRLCRAAIWRGDVRHGGGDGGLSSVVLLRLKDILDADA